MDSSATLEEPHVLRQYQARAVHYREVAYPVDFEMEPHDHDVDCVVFVRKGALGGRMEGSDLSVPRLGTLFVPAGCTHSNRFHGAVRTFDVVFAPEFSAVFRDTLSAVAGTPELPAGLAAPIAERMVREVRQPDTATHLALEGLTLELLSELIRAGSKPSAPPPAWLDVAIDFLHANLHESLTLSQVAEAVGVHPSHLSRMMRRHHRCTVADYLRGIRLDRAMRLVGSTDRPLADIAFESGFLDQSHFCRAFKAHAGRTPSAYRSESRTRV